MSRMTTPGCNGSSSGTPRPVVIDWQVRATDATGATQTSEVNPPAPDGATGYHSRTVTIS